MLPNYTPVQWLQIGLANAYGRDKLNFQDRLEWAENVSSIALESLVPDDPAYALAMLDGLLGNHRVRVHLDATASG